MGGALNGIRDEIYFGGGKVVLEMLILSLWAVIPLDSLARHRACTSRRAVAQVMGPWDSGDAKGMRPVMPSAKARRTWAM